LISRKGQCRDYTNVYLALSRTAGIPARRVSGWVITEWQPPAGWEFVVGTTPDGKTVASHAWIQVFVPGEGWVQVEPQSKKPDLYVGELPYEVYKQVEVKQTWMEALAAYETARGLI
jgi:transglutaminase-like putative cysteine protease